MVRVDTLLLAKYGILQPTHREGPLTMTIMHPIADLDREERQDLLEFAELMIAEHENDYPALAEALREIGDDGYAGDDGRHDEDDEGVLHDEA